MHSLGIDIDASRRWGFRRSDRLRAVCIGPIRIWWLKGWLVGDQMLENAEDLETLKSELLARKKRFTVVR